MPLADSPFAYRIPQDQRVLVRRGGRQVAVVAGSRAVRLIAALGRDDDADQQLLARVTGNYRRGNERGR